MDRRIGAILIKPVRMIFDRSPESPDFGRLLAAGQLIDDGDFEGGFFQLRKLEREGSKSATFLLAHMYETSAHGFHREIVQAVRLYEKLIRERETLAYLKLGRIYLQGDGIPKDFVRAFDLYSAIAKAGEPVAQFVVGDMYRQGLHTGPNLKTSYEWFKLAADNGHLYAALNAAALKFQQYPQLTTTAKYFYTFICLSPRIALLKVFRPEDWRLARS